MINEIINGMNLDNKIQDALKDIYIHGPSKLDVLEVLAHIKEHHEDYFKKYENRLVTIMGLFYKSNFYESFYDHIFSIYYDSIRNETKHNFTPVQAKIYKNIKANKYFSFSSPTSTGKSFIFRELLKENKKDTVIIVPSRALISEYINEMNSFLERDV